MRPRALRLLIGAALLAAILIPVYVLTAGAHDLRKPSKWRHTNIWQRTVTTTTTCPAAPRNGPASHGPQAAQARELRARNQIARQRSSQHRRRPKCGTPRLDHWRESPEPPTCTRSARRGRRCRRRRDHKRGSAPSRMEAQFGRCRALNYPAHPDDGGRSVDFQVSYLTMVWHPNLLEVNRGAPVREDVGGTPVLVMRRFSAGGHCA